MGGKVSPTYSSWRSILYRTKGKPQYHGVYVDPRWAASFEAFLEDMGERPDGMTVDRIDNSKGYFKANCRWADATTQSRNRRHIRRFTIDGHSLTAKEWADRSGLSYATAFHRLNTYGTLELP